MPQKPQDELESSLTALLLGELPHEQAAALHQRLAQDAELAKLYERLKHTINLVRETLATPAAQIAGQPTPLKLSDHRREKLLQHFKTVVPKEFVPPRHHAMRWLVPVGIAAALVVIIGAIALPMLQPAKTRSMAYFNNSLAPAGNQGRVQVSGQASVLALKRQLQFHQDLHPNSLLEQAAPKAEGPMAGTVPASSTEAPPQARIADASIVLPKATELADAITTPAGTKGAVAWSALGTMRGFYEDSLGQGGGMGGGGGFGGGGSPGGGVRGDASAQAAPRTSSEAAGAAESRVFRLVNGDPSETAHQLAQLFPEPTASSRGSQTPMTPFFFGGGPGGQGGNTGTAANGSDQTEKMGRVLAVPDPRTSSVIVTAPKNLMPQIADLVTELDSDKGRKETIGVYDLQGADAQDVYNNLHDLFNRNNVRPQNNNVNPMLGTSSPMYQREKANTQPTSQGTSAGFGGGGFGAGMSPGSTGTGAGGTARQYPNNGSVGDAFFSMDAETRRVVNIEAPPPAAVPALIAKPAPAQEAPGQAVASQPAPVPAAPPAEPALVGKSIEVEGVPFQALGKDKAAGDLTTGLQAAVPGMPAPDVSNAGKLRLEQKVAGLDGANKLADATASKVMLQGLTTIQGPKQTLKTAPVATATPLAGSTLAQQAETKQALADEGRPSPNSSSYADRAYGGYFNSQKAPSAGAQGVAQARPALRSPKEGGFAGGVGNATLPPSLTELSGTAVNEAALHQANIILSSQSDRKALAFDWYQGNSLAGKGQPAAQDGRASSEPGKAPVLGKEIKELAARSEPAPAFKGTPQDLPVLGDMGVAGRLFRAETAEGQNQVKDQVAAGAVKLPVEEKAKSVELADQAGLGLEKARVEGEQAGGQSGGPGPYSFNVVGYVNVPLTATNSLHYVEPAPKEPSTVERYANTSKLPEFAMYAGGATHATRSSIVLPPSPETRLPLKDSKDVRLFAAANQPAATPEYPQQQDEKLREAQKKVDDLRAKLQVPAQANQGPAADLTSPKPAAPAPIPQPEVQTADNAFSTFSLNVSDVSFKLAAASLEKGVMPDPATVRSEEFINAFDYRDPEPPPGVPVAFAWERAQYPFAQNRDLLRFSIKTAALGRQPGRALNIVLLLDNSGSMERADRVRIIHEALCVLASQLQPQDILSVVTFSRTAHLWVDGVPGSQAAQVAEEVSGLTPQGGTNLEDAMNLAYQTALRHYLANGINRVVLLTDGAANLGNVDPEALKQKVEAHRKQGVALDCFGIGWEGYNDDLLEVLSRNGDGRYAFLNSPEEVASEFAAKLAGALQVAASDVKVQVEFNPGRVTAYRQIGYAKHQLTKEQFRDNTVNAAQIGAAEAGNALYTVEVNPAGAGPLCTVRVRFRIPGTTDYREHAWDVPFTGNAVALEQASPAMRLAATASALSEWLASSPYAAEVTPDRLLGYLSGVPEVYGADARPKKLEWMIRQAKSIAGK
ncbi:MAG: YfbK domain-containing protein [Limisphaerales bacterium]